MLHVKTSARLFHYYILAMARDPPLSVVRKFVHLLEQSPLDLQEEQEFTRLREEVVTNIRSNQQMEKDLNMMDIKIGLLVKNRITLQVSSTFRISEMTAQVNAELKLYLCAHFLSGHVTWLIWFLFLF